MPDNNRPDTAAAAAAAAAAATAAATAETAAAAPTAAAAAPTAAAAAPTAAAAAATAVQDDQLNTAAAAAATAETAAAAPTLDNQPTGDDQLLLISRRKAAEGRQVPTPNPANRPTLSSIFGESSIGEERQAPPPAPRLGPQPAPADLMQAAGDGFLLDRTESEASTTVPDSPSNSPLSSATSTPAQSPRQ